MLKSAVSSYKDAALEDAIEKYRKEVGAQAWKCS